MSHHHERENSCCCHHHTDEHKDLNHHHHECECCCHHHDSCGCGHEHTHNHFIVLIIRTIITISLIIVSSFLTGIATNVVLSIAYIVIAYDVLFNAAKGLLKGKAFDENFLMSIASLTALIVPFFTDKAHIDPYDGILVIVLYQVGEFIQHKAVDKSKKSISDMLDLDVEKVTIIENEITKEINVNDIKLNDVIIVKPGDLIVVDGIVIYGNSSINTSSLTGESLPKDVYPDEEVLSGCINNDGLIHIKATSTFKTSTTAKVKEIVEKANKNKANIDRFFTRFAKVYTPVVICISLFVMFILPLFFGFNEHFLTFLYKGLAVMVISCPCALVISIPLSYFMGIGKAAKNKILIKGATYLEMLAECDAILFDKTGTLTKGEFKVSYEYSLNSKLMNDLLYSCEINMTHAIAKSIVNHLEGKASLLEIEDLINHPGYGIEAKYNNKPILIGNEKLLENHNISYEKSSNKLTTIYVSYDNEFLGYLSIEDELKNDSVKTINSLINKYEIHIISGDKEESVKRVSNQLGIKNYHFELLPNDKIEILEKVKNNKKVIYVGDGINDAASLIAANVGIGMKSIGSDIAIEASDIVLMDDRLESVSKAIAISKKTKNIVIQNIIFSLFVKTLVMFLAIFIMVPMYIAIIADVGVAMIAILNALRILYTKKL